MNPRTGRPPLPEGQARTAVLRIRFTAAEYDAIIERGGGDWAHDLLIRALKRRR